MYYAKRFEYNKYVQFYYDISTICTTIFFGVE